jgi:hypothetical protein
MEIGNQGEEGMTFLGEVFLDVAEAALVLFFKEGGLCCWRSIDRKRDGG